MTQTEMRLALLESLLEAKTAELEQAKQIIRDLQTPGLKLRGKEQARILLSK